MNDDRYNPSRSSSRRVASTDPDATGTLPKMRSSRRATSDRVTADGSRTKRPRAAGAQAGRSHRRTSQDSRGTNFMRYASDNRVVRTIYALTTGPYRALIFLAVAVVLLAGLYLPVRDLYTAWRTGDVLERQLEIRRAFNDAVGDEVDGLLSTDGVEEAARELGLVMPGEQVIDVIGLDDTGDQDAAPGAEPDGDAAAEGQAEGEDAAGDQGGKAGDGATAQGSDDRAADATGAAAGAVEDQGAPSESDADADADGASSEDTEPQTSAEVTALEHAVVDDVPWYIKFLDGIFFYQGPDGQTVTSTGE